jgi:hypothetical protein
LDLDEDRQRPDLFAIYRRQPPKLVHRIIFSILPFRAFGLPTCTGVDASVCFPARMRGMREKMEPWIVNLRGDR